MPEYITLSRFIIEEQRKYPEATGEFSSLFSDISTASKIVYREVNRAGIAEILGATGTINVFGEEVQKLDEFALKTFVGVLSRGGYLAGMASEETASVIKMPEDVPKGKYLFAFDPLDGSSNIDVNVSVGTIFGIWKKKDGDGDATEEDFLQPGSEMVAAGYVIYGSSAMLVYSTGQGVHGFTLDPSVGEFILSHHDIRIPEKGKIYSANEGYFNRWNEAIRKFVEYLKEEDKTTGRPYSARYIGSLVSDFHRNLLKGGIFFYPADAKHPKGKLRLLYEAAPLAFIVEQAGGAATDGKRRILDIIPENLHHRTPLVIGSKKDVELFGEFIEKYGG
ncbi:MAG: class 1 fructose-bisphosphatase [Candidatus Aminicenantes bacterium]|nr:class 1 fructose-bisphosphatase [Candidatus Aminicenantes bacterium]